ncbi:hypothetical protein ACFL1E_01885 [Candidatus Omnitrophota bacterium]
MKKTICLLLLAAFLVGCAYGKDKMETLFIDQDYIKYKQLEDELEKDYLNGYISYHEYVTRKDELNQERLKSEQTRQDIITGQEQ